mmetsp:Transcript_50813/g.121018  ORF Transcript_50813/g.121018 Transcript_50813/m.121018 type:complete len:173 (-) Transcript_50813:242-760(-)
MLRLSLLAAAAASASAFAPAGFSPKLRSAAPTATMAMKGPDAAGMLAGAALSFSIILGGAPMMPADASVNSQMAMDSKSYSVLTESQKVYSQKERAINPYATEEQKMAQLEKIARLEECQQGRSMKECEVEETAREETVLNAAKKKNNPLTFAVPVLVTTAISGVVVKLINK